MEASWHDVIRRGDAAAVRAQLARGANANARDRYGQTGLMLAAQAGHRDVAATLIDYGVDLNVTAKLGLSALMLAIVAGHRDIVRLRVSAGANLALQGSGTPGFANKTARELADERGMAELFAASDCEPPTCGEDH